MSISRCGEIFRASTILSEQSGRPCRSATQGQTAARRRWRICGAGILTALVMVWLVLAATPSRAMAQFYQGPVLDAVHVDTPFHAQDTLVWCWVATAKMVVESLGEYAPNQCEMLEQVYGAPCCSNPGLCSRPGHISEIQNLIATFGYSMSRLSSHGDGQQIFDILQYTGAPIVAWVDGSHFVVITGMTVAPSAVGPWGIVRIYDPIRGRFDQDWPVFSRRLGAILYVD